MSECICSGVCKVSVRKIFERCAKYFVHDSEKTVIREHRKTFKKIYTIYCVCVIIFTYKLCKRRRAFYEMSVLRFSGEQGHRFPPR